MNILRKKRNLTFFDPAFATKELVDELYETGQCQDQGGQDHCTGEERHPEQPRRRGQPDKTTYLLIWGNNDSITPPFVGEEFRKLIPNSELQFIDKCGHAPMMSGRRVQYYFT